MYGISTATRRPRVDGEPPSCRQDYADELTLTRTSFRSMMARYGFYRSMTPRAPSDSVYNVWFGIVMRVTAGDLWRFVLYRTQVTCSSPDTYLGVPHNFFFGWAGCCLILLSWESYSLNCYIKWALTVSAMQSSSIFVIEPVSL